MRTVQYAALTFTMLAAAGCATSGSSTREALEAAERSKAYLTGLEVLPMHSKDLDTAQCAVPAASSPTTSAPATGPSKDWQNLVERANRCATEQNWKVLNELGDTIAKADVDSPWGAYFLSVAAEGQGKYSRAIWMIDLAQKKVGGTSGLFLYQRGRIWLKMNDVSKAMNDIQKAVDLQPSLGDGHVYLGEIYFRDQEFKKAESHFRSALKLDSKSYRALTGLAETRLMQDDVDEAVVLYDKALSSHGSRLQPWIRLAWIYETHKKNKEQALNTYKGLRKSVHSGSVKEKPDFDLVAKITDLEKSIQADNARSTASSQQADEKRSVK